MILDSWHWSCLYWRSSLCILGWEIRKRQTHDAKTFIDLQTCRDCQRSHGFRKPIGLLCWLYSHWKKHLLGWFQVSERSTSTVLIVLTCFNIGKLYEIVTYGPHKAVAEVSNHNEPIGRTSGIQLVRKIRKSMDFTFSCFVLNWLTD